MSTHKTRICSLDTLDEELKSAIHAHALKQRTNFHSPSKIFRACFYISVSLSFNGCIFYRYKCRESPGKVIRRGYPSFASADAFCVPDYSPGGDSWVQKGWRVFA
jgi:hypothetical protein